MTIENLSLSDHGYKLLLLATSQSKGDNRNLMYQAYFEVVYSLLVEGNL